ncbi:AbrB/MazE/SpoVT family DNA-binding domain-containing protein [Desulfurococcaceae archaeon MEX13E-LK6-19]|nr:AbrB/MazE/SpoVT family DNA-binding domain-containing protein [Desulfurococcaceae archaeon MEX13E-LK6-19]
MVERRKIQRTGSSSFIVTLPKEWIESMGIKPGDYVLVYEHADKLIITPSEKEGSKLSTEIRVSESADVDEILRVIVSQYLAGYDTITIVFKPNTPGLAKKINTIKNMARAKLAGVEVVDETYNTLTLKILLNLRELPLTRALRRLHLIVNNMLVDALEAFKDKNMNLAEAVIQRDDEADRFHFMITRQLSLALLDIRVMHELGINNPIETLNYRILARNLERIADHAVNISKRVKERPDECRYCEKIYEFGKKVLELFNKSMESIYRLNRKIAEEVIRESQTLITELENLLSKEILVGHINDQEKIVLALIYDSLRRIIRYSSGIAEATLNIKASRTNIIDVK